MNSYEKTPRHHQMLQGKNSSFEGQIQHHYMEEKEVEGEQRRCFLLDQCHSKCKNSMHGKSNYNNLPQHSSFPECRFVKIISFDQKPFQN